MNEDKKRLETMKAVYCYFFPETRNLLKEVEKRIPDEMFLVTTSAKTIEESIKGLFTPNLKIPETIDGKVNLDEIHIPIIERIIKSYSTVVPALSGFDYSYPTSGSSEGLFHLLANLKTKGVEAINVLEGEYEGYEAQARNLGMKTRIVSINNIKKQEPAYWFISNPSARDGNIILNNMINELCDAGNKVILDLAYVGSTTLHEFDVSHENIIAAVMSFSKPYGVFRSRIGGFTFARNEIPSLYGNKWFKDVTRLFQALKIAEEIGPETLHKKYEQTQKRIISGINKEFGLNMKQSDALLLGYMNQSDAIKLDEKACALIEPFIRGSGYRFCLTPYFEHYEKIGVKHG